MALPTSYLTTIKNLEGILAAMRNAKAPDKFTTRFLESLDYKSAADRLIIGVLKSIGFLDGEGKPQDRYFRFLDQTQSASVIAEGVREAYADLFQTNTKAQNLSKTEVVNKFKTLSQGQISEAVLDKMAMTFLALSKIADFDSKSEAPTKVPEAQKDTADVDEKVAVVGATRATKSVGGLHYNIQIILPESRDPKVYDALFRSLREHLFE